MFLQRHKWDCLVILYRIIFTSRRQLSLVVLAQDVIVLVSLFLPVIFAWNKTFSQCLFEVAVSARQFSDGKL